MHSEMAAFAHGSAIWRTRRNIHVIFDSWSSSTKHEVRNALQKTIELRPQVIC